MDICSQRKLSVGSRKSPASDKWSIRKSLSPLLITNRNTQRLPPSPQHFHQKKKKKVQCCYDEPWWLSGMELDDRGFESRLGLEIFLLTIESRLTPGPWG